MYTFIYYNNKVYLYTASSTVHDMPRLHYHDKNQQHQKTQNEAKSSAQCTSTYNVPA